MKRLSRAGNRGLILISSYLLLSMFLIYSNAVTVRTLTHAKVVDQLRERLQAMDLAQGAMEQLREDLYAFLIDIVNAQVVSNNAVLALEWLDAVGNGTESPPFDIPMGDRNGDGKVTVADGDGTPDGRPAHPRCLTGLPLIKATGACLPTTEAVQAPRAWIVSVVKDPAANPADPFASRLVTMQAEAQVGGIKKLIRATYTIALGMSEIFRYAYFVNNVGWFDINPSAASLFIYGEVRSNGDLIFMESGVPQDETYGMYIQGDLYASENSALSATGTISGDPMDISAEYWTFRNGLPATRPERRLVFPGQPEISGGTSILPYGYGWDTAQPDQQKFEGLPTHDIPYLGDLTLYKQLAKSFNGGSGSSLTYLKPGPDGLYDTADDVPTTITALEPGPDGLYDTSDDVLTTAAIYAGPDGRVGTPDDTAPLVLYGTDTNPIRINGPAVIPGDVLIRGGVTGQGTIYAGRNIHVVGSIGYMNPPEWPGVVRHQDTGQLRLPYDDISNLGTVCQDGRYVAPGVPPPGGCMP